MVVLVSSSSPAEVDVVEGGVDRKVRRLLDDQRPLGKGEAKARQRSVPADVSINNHSLGKQLSLPTLLKRSLGHCDCPFLLICGWALAICSECHQGVDHHINRKGNSYDPREQLNLQAL